MQADAVRMSDYLINEMIAAFTTHNRFTGGQRWETFGLNLLLGGFGSLLVVDDMTGAAVQMIPWIVGFPLFFAGLIIGDIPAITIAGGVLWAGQNVYNVIRSVTFGRRTRTAFAAAPEAWNITITPGKNGIEQVSLSRIIRF